MNDSAEQPVEELLCAEKAAVLSIFIQLWVLDQNIFFVLDVHGSIADERKQGKDYIVKLHHPPVVQILSCEARVDAKNELRCDEQQILVNRVENDVRILSVALTPVNKQQAFELFELAN